MTGRANVLQLFLHPTAALTGRNNGGIAWDDRARTYFESDLKDQDFPCDSKSTPLDLAAWGGAAFSSKGAHRLVAAVCWLSSNPIYDAVLRQARVTYWPLHPATVSLMASATREQQAIAYFRHGSGWLIRVGEAPAARYFLMPKKRSDPTNVKRCDLWSVLRSDNNGEPFDSPTDDPLNLKRLAPEHVLALADESWLKQ